MYVSIFRLNNQLDSSMSLTVDNDNFPKMTKKSIRAICKKLNLYLTPELNDIIYLHFQGFSKIENLDEYTGLKCLWLESNGISKIENIGHLLKLKCLYLQQNLIEEIENLETLSELDTLNLSNNSLSKLQDLSYLTNLHTLLISHNYFKTAEDIMELKLCPSIGILDLQHNKLDDPNVIDIFSQMPNLGVLTLQGNPVINNIKFYRKVLICSIVSLKFLDDRPVFDKDRAAALAWQKGGLSAEREERQRWSRMEQDRILASVDALRHIRETNFGCENGNQITEAVDNIPSDDSVQVECDEIPRVLSVNCRTGEGVEPYNEVVSDGNVSVPIECNTDSKNSFEPFLVTELPSDSSIEEIDLTTNRNVSIPEPSSSIFSDTSLVHNKSLLFDFSQSNTAVHSDNKSKRPLLIEECEDESGTNSIIQSSDCVPDFETERDSSVGFPLITGDSEIIVPIGTNNSTLQTETSLITELDSDSENSEIEPISSTSKVSSDFIEYFSDLKGVNIVTTALDENEIVSLETKECDKPMPYTPPSHEVIQNLAELIGTTTGTGTGTIDN